jgi:CubicO group peptidase (beta-lactamase class C family)
LSLSTNFEQGIEATVSKAMQAWHIPGLALVIVKNDKVLLTKGYGVRESGKPEPVDEHTLFAIGSNTKAFTATAIGLLVQEGKAGWDDAVTKYIPSFQLYDEHATRLITLRDLVCNRSGLGTWAGDLLLSSRYSTEEIIRRIRYIPPAFGFRAGFGYSNLMFITAGHIISSVSGMSWDEFIEERIFKPMGMTDSVTHPRYFGKRTNIAAPHLDGNGSLQPMAHPGDMHTGASGSICASAADLALWLRLQLNQGSMDGKRIVDPAIIAETHTPHTLMRLKAAQRKLFPSRHFAAYGLGWMLSDTYGRLNIHHTGDVYGMLSNIVLIPEEQLGIAVLTNKLPNAAYIALSHYLSQRLTGMPPQDWINIYIDLENEKNAREAQTRKQKEQSRAENTHPSFQVEKYAGDFESTILGGATVRLDGGTLHIRLHDVPSGKGRLKHNHADTFLCKWESLMFGESLIPFIVDGQGEVVEFHVTIREDWIDPLEHVFIRKSRDRNPPGI